MTVFALKIIAVLCMMIDHTGAAFSSMTPIELRWIGRISFPIYVYLIAEGCTRTKNINRYTLRLAIFALISEIPYDLAFSHSITSINFISGTNVFYTLALGVAAVNLYKRLSEKTGNLSLSAIIVLPFMGLAQLLTTDYAWFGVIWIFVMCLANSKKKKLAVLFLGIFYKYGVQASRIIWLFATGQLVNIPISGVMFFVFALIPVLLISIYNGKQGIRLKWLFYWIYPCHLLVLALIYSFTVMPIW